jgi:DNA polymerase-3 subunit beta
MGLNFKISRLHLLKGLTVASRAISSKSPIPALSGLKFDLTKDGLTLIGTDGEITISTKIDANIGNENIITVIEEGSALLSARLVTEIIRKIESERIGIELIDSNLIRIYDNNSNFNLNGFKVEDYPNIDLNCDGSSISLSSDDLRTAIQQTAFAGSDKENRIILTGVNIKAYDSMLEFTATDSYRLASKKIKLKQLAEFNVTIPAKNLIEVSRLIENESRVTVNVSDRKIIFNLDNTIISSKLINGQYPDTSKLIPSSFESRFETLAGVLISAIDRASLLSVDRSNVVKLSLSSDKVEITSKSQEIGSVTEKIDSFKYEGPRLDISFTSKFVIEAIRAIGTEEVTILFNGDMKPFILKNNNDESVLQLILPVRTY